MRTMTADIEDEVKALRAALAEFARQLEAFEEWHAYVRIEDAIAEPIGPYIGEPTMNFAAASTPRANKQTEAIGTALRGARSTDAPELEIEIIQKALGGTGNVLARYVDQ